MNTLVVKVNSMSDHLQKKDEEIHLQIGLDNSQLRVQFLEGRLARMEKEIDDLQEDLLQEKARSMRSNLVFSNIEERINEKHSPSSTELFQNRYVYDRG